ncbi:cation:proton antiporter [Planctomicrobium sp. SH668]|uniref:cation:proton antiporter n=1 Tax=Planctomicrobium sp. SH668 TaxID=3448126 RepID=UPI003F5B9F3B
MEHQSMLVALAGVIILGTGAKWIAWWLKLPSILLLLGFGFIAGPVLHIVSPDEMLGELLFPFISICVAIILFEGSLSLHFSQLKEMGSVLLWILTVGAAVTWGLSLLGAHFILGMPWLPATLLGAILVVTGPTVIGPILRHIRPIGQVGPIARWEGIVIDPIGAVLAVLVFEAYRATLDANVNHAWFVTAEYLIRTLLVGGSLGAISAWILVKLLKSHAIPDHLESLVTILLVVASFAGSNLLQTESGLVAVTLMGVLVANSGANLKHIIEFKESLSLLLISGLFILLAARVNPVAFAELGWRGVLFVAFMILIVRPASIFLSTITSNLKWQEKVFLSWLAPRGIVAAAVASVFAIQLGPEDGAMLVPATFSIIVGTVIVYGLTALPLAKRLNLAIDNPQGVLIVGAHRIAQELGEAIQEAGYPVLLVDTNHWNINAARLRGLRTADMNILQEEASEVLDLGGIGRMLALTSNDEVNALATISFSELFSRSNVFQLPPRRAAEKNEQTVQHLRARYLFNSQLTFGELEKRFEAGDHIKTTKLTKEFDFAHFNQTYGSSAIPLFISHNQRLTICDAEEKIDPKPGQTIIALVPHEIPQRPLLPEQREETQGNDPSTAAGTE